MRYRSAAVARSDDASHLARLFRAIYQVVRRVPRGRVATYGQVAELAGIPGGGRIAGAAMKVSSAEGLPWHRIVGKRARATGRIAIYDPVGAAVQRGLLEREGVVVSAAGTIDLSRHGWSPAAPRVRARPGRAAPPRPPLRSGSRRPASPSRR